jgi:integrase/recombinase XerD
MRKYLKESEIDRLLEAAKTPRDKLIIKLLYETGMRSNELTQLRIEDIDYEINEITIQTAKAHKEGRKVPLLTDSTIQRLKTYIGNRTSGPIFYSQRGQPINNRTLRHVIEYCGKRAGLQRDKCHPHILRHSHAVHSLKSGIDLRTLQSNLGHSNIATTAIYTGMDLEDRKAQYRKKWDNPKPEQPTATENNTNTTTAKTTTNEPTHPHALSIYQTIQRLHTPTNKSDNQ